MTASQQYTQQEKLLIARSVELAERAKRLQQRSDMTVRNELKSVADLLVQTTDMDRFYYAQSALEEESVWSDDRRSFAHELNLIDLNLNNIPTLEYDQSIVYINNLADSYAKSDDDDVVSFGRDLQQTVNALMSSEGRPATKGQYITQLLVSIEQMLASIHSTLDTTTPSATVRHLRTIRDSILIERAVGDALLGLIDDALEDIEQGQRITASREALAEIYSHVTTLAG